MPLIKNFRNEFGGGWASVYTATAKRHFVYKHRSDIKKGVTVTVEYKGETCLTIQEFCSRLNKLRDRLRSLAKFNLGKEPV